MVRWRQFRCKILAALAFVLSIFYFFRVIWFIWREESCSFIQSKENIQLLCDDYKDGHLTGSMCPYVCETKEIVLHKCLNYVGGKEIYLTLWKGENLIMKSKKPSWHDYQRFLPYGLQADQANMTVLLYFITETIKDSFNIKSEASLDLLERYWFPANDRNDANYVTDAKERLRVIESIWSLFQQDEYVSVMHLKHSKFMPLLYGTCGHYYFMEYLPAGKSLSSKLLPYGLFEEDVSWKSKIATSLYLLELIRSLDSDFNEVIHMCDLKGANFGVSKDGAIKIVDVDMLLSNSKLLKIYSGFNCSSDRDCDFFDCKAKCDVAKGSCVKSRSNTNLQVLCEQIFRNHLQNAYHGLLHNPPEQMEIDLNKLLDRCVTTNTKDSNLLDDLYKFLNFHLYTQLMPQHSEQ